MANEETKAPVIATLVHGMYYDHKGIIWDNHKVRAANGTGNASLAVDEETEAYLREHAVIAIEVDGTDFSKQRFTFSNDDAKPARKRVRSE